MLTTISSSLRTLLRFWGVFQFTQVQPLPSPHKQCWTGVYSRIFFWVSTLYRVGGGRTERKFRTGCTVLRGNREMTEKYEYCSIVPRTFVQDCGYELGQSLPDLSPFQKVKWLVIAIDSEVYFILFCFFLFSYSYEKHSLRCSRTCSPTVRDSDCVTLGIFSVLSRCQCVLSRLFIVVELTVSIYYLWCFLVHG